MAQKTFADKDYVNAELAKKSNTSHTHTSILYQDTRAVNTTPAEVPTGLSVHLKSNGTDGLSDGGTYHSTLMIKGWNDKSGGPWGQIAVTQNNNLYFRSSASSSDTAWNAWKKASLDGHTHNYAGSSSAGGAATSANKVNQSLAIKLNGGTTEGTNLFTFNGSTAKTINITPSSIGAAASSHGTHLSLGETSSTAYRGDRGKTAYDHSQVAHAPSNAQKNSDITKAEIEAKLTGTITSHAHSSVNKTFITTPIYNPNNGVLVDFNLNVKSGVMAIVKIYGNSYSTNPPIEAIYQFYDYASGDIQNCTGTAISGPPITLKVYKADGKLKAWFQQPNNYCTFKVEVAYGNNSSTPNITLSNAAEPATNITQTVTITPDRVYSAKYKPTAADIGAAASSHGNHVPATQTAQNNTFLRNDNTWQKVTPANIGAAAASHGTHVTFSTTTPKANGTAAVGSENTVARGDHVHPLQTSVSGSSGSCTGNAATATKFASAQSVALTGDVTGSASSQAGWSVATTLANSGVTAGSYGPSANASPAHGKTFSVPYLTVDAKGRVTAASTKTITLPADNNTDTKVTNTVNTSTKYYVTGSSSASTNTGTQIFDTNVYVDATAGKFVATTMAVNNKVQMQYNSTSESLDFIFI